MSPTLILAALAGGFIAGYLGMRAMDSLAGLGFCLHALITARWRRLAGKPPVREVRTGILLRLLLQVSLLAALFVILLYYGYALMPEEAWLGHHGRGTILYAAAACATALLRLSATRRRLLFYWRMSHEYDYAQRRQRTLLLKS